MWYTLILTRNEKIPGRNIERQLSLELGMDGNLSADVGMGRGKPASNEKLSLSLELSRQERVVGLLGVATERRLIEAEHGLAGGLAEAHSEPVLANL